MNRNRILKSAHALFFSTGIKALTVADICHSLGISKKTFYVWFTDKDDIVHEFVEGVFAEAMQRLHKVTFVSDAVEKLKLFDEYVVELLMTLHPLFLSDLKRFHHRSYELTMDFRSKLVVELAAIIELGKYQNVFRKSIDSLILAELRFTELETIHINRKQIGLKEINSAQQQLFDHYLSGLIRY